MSRKKGISLLVVSLLLALAGSTAVYADNNVSESVGTKTEDIQKTDETTDNENDHENQDNKDCLEPELKEGQESMPDLSVSEGADIDESTVIYSPLVQDSDKNKTENVQDNKKRAYGWYFNSTEKNWYFYDREGNKESGWLKWGNKWYYLDWGNVDFPCVMVADCKMKIGAATYFFDVNGGMQTGWVRRPEGWYYADGNGAMVSGWQKVGGKWYYMDNANEENPGLMAANGEYKIGSRSYFFDGSGAMQTGWVRRPEGWYYADGNGIKVSGWQKVGGKWYYMDSNAEGKMLSDGWARINNLRYYFDKSGSMATDWVKLDGLWYYLASGGSMVEGWRLINGDWYYFYYEQDGNKTPDDKWGSMAVNKVIDGWAIQANGKAYKIESLEEKIQRIKTYIYVPYRLGGANTKGWDCSGFTMWALEYLGVTIPRTSSLQAAYGTNVDKNDMSKWKPGDLLFYKQGTTVNHVALYLGDGMLMHALNSKYGTLIQGVDYYEYWDSKNTLASVRRYL